MRKLSLALTLANQSEHDIDMTPMLDIVFIMLIFFIVTSSFIKESALDVNRPSATEPTPGPATPLTLLELTADNRILSNGRELDVALVAGLLEQQLATEPATAVLIQADQDSNTALMLRLVDIAKRAGTDKISVASYAAR